jgi:ABC-type nickel/cobalt efflux system permease component RcnA
MNRHAVLLTVFGCYKAHQTVIQPHAGYRRQQGNQGEAKKKQARFTGTQTAGHYQVHQKGGSGRQHLDQHGNRTAQQHFTLMRVAEFLCKPFRQPVAHQLVPNSLSTFCNSSFHGAG